MKKWFAILLCIALLLGTAACTSNQEEQAPPVVETPNMPTNPETVGKLTLNMNAAITLHYDKNGYVLSVICDNDTGAIIVDSLSTTVGLSCSTLVKNLVDAISNSDYGLEQNIVLLKLSADSQVPSETFLSDIQAEVEKIAGNRFVITVPANALTAEGLLSPEAAKNILAKQLAAENVTIEGEPELQDGYYWFTVTEADGSKPYYRMDANLGTVEWFPPDPVVDTPDSPHDEFGDGDLNDMNGMPEDFDPNVGGEPEVSFGDETDPTEETTEETTGA